MQKDIELDVRRFSARQDSSVHFVGEQRPALFWTTDTALRITSAQGSFAVLSLQPDRLIGTNLSDILHRHDPDLRFLNAHQRALEGTSTRFTAAWSNRLFDLHIEPFRGPDGKICGAIGAALETTGRKPTESASDAGERRFRALIENSSDMIALVAADGTILYASPSTTRVLGYPLEELVGRSAVEFIHPDDCERTKELIVELLEKPCGRVATECRLLDKEGTWRWIEGTGNSLLAEPSLQAVVINYRDISERKRAEEALRQSEARYRVVAETATDAFVTIGSSSQILFVNAAAERIFGYSRSEMLGQELTMLMPEYLRHLRKAGLKRYLKTDRKHLNWESVEVTGLHKNGTEIPLEVSFGQYIVNGEHTFTGIVRDTSERRRAEEALRQAEEKYRSIVENAVEGFFQTTPEGGYVSVNPALARMYGYESPKELMANVSDIGNQIYCDPSRRAEFKRLMEVQGVVRNFEYQVYRRDHKKIWLSESARTVWDSSGKVLYYEGTVEDVTERKRAETERQAMFEIIHGVTVTANLDELLHLVHEALRKVLYAENCFVALYHRQTGMFHFPFLVDRFDAAPPPQKVGRSCTAYVFRTGQPMLIPQSLFDQLAARGEVELVGTPSPSWLGVPLRTPSETIGVLVVQNYEEEETYTERDLEFLASVGGQIALAIERKQIEDAIRKQQIEQQVIFNSAPYMIWYKDRENRILRANKAAAESMGLSVAEVEGRSTQELYPEEADRYHQDDLEVIRSGKPKLRIIEPYRVASGGKRWVATDKIPYRDQEGNIIGVIVFATDITEQQRAEEALRRSEGNYRSLVHNAPYGIYRVTAEGELLDVNPALVEMLGYGSEAELLRANLDRDVFCSPAEAARLREHDSGRLEGAEVAWKRKDGTLITVRLSGRPVRDANEAEVCYERIAENVTQQRALEHQLRQAQKMEAVGRLAGGVAHDFNNLLMVIKGHTELLVERGCADEWQSRKVEQIQKSAERAASLTRQLLAFSRMQILQPKVIDLNAVVMEMGKLLPPLIGEHIELAILTDPRLGRAKADPGQIEQVIMNLAVNARDAMPQGGKLLIETLNAELDEAYARLHPPLVPGYYVMLAISDTGVGMDAETQAHAFEPFFTTKEKGKGTGLGLATVYGVIKQSGGYIWLYSEPGQGTTFKIFLPRVQEAVEETRPVKAPEPPLGSETILLVEDERDVREVAREFLSLSGYTVLEARDGAEAMEIAARHAQPIHLLVTDMVMPGMGGRELAARLAPLRPEMKVVYMSGYTEYAHTRHGESNANSALLTKPFTRGTLARTVRGMLHGGKRD